MFHPRDNMPFVTRPSRSKQKGYVDGSKKIMTSPRAVLAYTTAVTIKTTIYKNPKDYLMVCMQ